MDVIAFNSAREALDHVEHDLAGSGAEGEMAYGLLHGARSPATIVVARSGADALALVVHRDGQPALITGFVDEHDIDFSALVGAMQRHRATPDSVNGTARCAVPFAAAWADELGTTPRLMRRTRAFELRVLRPPGRSHGHARDASASDQLQLEAWFAAFANDIGESVPALDVAPIVTSLIDAGDLMLWIAGERIASMAGVIRRTPHSSTISWVYTPPAQRGAGHASSVVAALSRRELDAGARWCSLFTDLANPTSNHIYTKLGYEPRCDFEQLGVR